MLTVSDVIKDVDRGILAHNMIETCFLYRIVYFINENTTGREFYIDTTYESLRRSLETIIRTNLSTTNNIVISKVTTRKNGEIVSLLNRSYPFSLDGYFQKICEEKENDDRNSNYRRRRANWY